MHVFFIREYNWDQDLVEKHLEKLKEKKIVKAMEHGAFTRIIQHEKDIQVCIYIYISKIFDGRTILMGTVSRFLLEFKDLTKKED